MNTPPTLDIGNVENRMEPGRWFLLCLWLATVPTLALYMLLRPSPRAQELRVLPQGWLRWLDEIYNFRTFILTAIVCVPVAWLLCNPKFARLRRYVLFGLLLTLAGAEVAQIWIPRRVFDWQDMGFTLMGVAAAELFALLWVWGRMKARLRMYPETSSR